MISIGDIFGKLTVSDFDGVQPKTKQKIKFLCLCGTEKFILLKDVKNGKVQSCGCIRRKHEVINGQIFGRLIVVNPNILKINGYENVLCKCSCGIEKPINLIKLNTGKVNSCGCLAKEGVALRNRTHGGRGNPLYSLWRGMKDRCKNKKNKNFHRYGGRGISVCQEWNDDYLSFQIWAENNGYLKGLQIDRENNNEGYSPKNCRFVTCKQNQNNRSSNVILFAFGESKSMSDWSDDSRCLVSYATLSSRVKKKKLTHEQSITQPSKNPRHGLKISKAS